MEAIEVMSALAQPTRLEVFTQLARARPDGLSSGALAERVGTPANTMSAHLAILSRESDVPCVLAAELTGTVSDGDTVTLDLSDAETARIGVSA